MQARELERLCRAIVPGEGPVEWQPLGQGLSNQTYQVVRAGAAFALKVPAEQRCELGMSFSWGVELLRRAAQAGLAAPVVYSDAQQAILLLRWAPGRTWKTAEAAQADKLAQFVATLRRVHGLSAPEPPRVMPPVAWIELYSGALLRAAAMPDTALRAAAELTLRRLAALPQAAVAVCHSDLHLLNLIEADHALTLLDWEYAHVSDPFWDLAGWSANNDFAAASQQLLVSLYLGAAPTQLEWRRFTLLRWLYDYVCLLWSELYLTVSRDNPGVAARIRQLDARLRDPAHYAA